VTLILKRLGRAYRYCLWKQMEVMEEKVMVVRQIRQPMFAISLTPELFQ